MRPITVEVSAPWDFQLSLRSGDEVIFGRGPEADVPTGRERWLSRRAGRIKVSDEGAQITNLSRREPLHVRTGQAGGETVLPAVLPGSDAVSCLLTDGAALIGSAMMLDRRRAVHIVLPERAEQPPPEPVADPGDPSARRDSRRLTTEQLLGLNEETKEFMVALLLCRPWLKDPRRIAPLPSEWEIALNALRCTSARHLLDALESVDGPRIQKLLTGQVHAHLRNIKKKLVDREFSKEGTPLGISAIASTLIAYDIVTPGHLRLLTDPYWLDVQENIWWTSVD